MNGTEQPEPAAAEPAARAPDADRSYDLCPYCGGPLLRHGESNPPGYRDYHVQADAAGRGEPRFCCQRQADATKQRERDRKTARREDSGRAEQF